MNDNIYTAVKALVDLGIFWQTAKLGFCEARMPIFGVKWGVGSDEFCRQDLQNTPY